MKDMPAGWERVTLREVCSVGKDKGIPSDTSSLPYIGMEHVQSDTGHVLQFAESLDYRSTAPRVQSGNVLYGRLRPYLNKVFVADCETFVSGEFIPLVVGERIDSRFLMYRLLSPDFVSFAVGLNAGDRPRVKWPQIAEFPLVLPPINEQQRIVATLEDHLSRLDAAQMTVGNVYRRSERLLASYRQRLLYPSGVSLVPLTDLVDVVNGSTPKGIAESALSDGGPDRIPYVKVGDMNFGDGVRVDSSRTWVAQGDAKRLGLRVAPPGTVIFPKRGGAIATNKKRVLSRPAAFDLNTMGIVPGAHLDPDFLRLYFESVDLMSMADGSNIPQINLKGVRELRIPLMNLSDQRVAVGSMEVVEKAVSRLQEAPLVFRAHALRRALLNAAFSGQLLKEAASV